ncbi:MAG: hypothetical protein M0P13_03300 [Fibrobacteraceae bacterium]|nr:hypothetical protein [Fibrobacteraceae bacterium]
MFRIFASLILILTFCELSSCAAYINQIYYEPFESIDNPEKLPFEAAVYRTRDFSLMGFAFTPILFFPAFPEDGPYDDVKNSFRLNVKGDECPVIHIKGQRSLRAIWKENQKLFSYNCEYGRLPIPEQTEYTLEYKGKSYRISFKKVTHSGYFPIAI